MPRRLVFGISLVGLLLGGALVDAQEDVAGSRDHQLLTRMPGFVIGTYGVDEFAAFEPTVVGGKAVHWEGKKFSFAYDLKEGATRVSPLQIVRNYEAAIKKVGGVVLGSDERRVAAEIKKDGALTGVYIEAFNEGRNYQLTIVESQAMRQDVTADAAAMSKDLQTSGRTVVYGLHFDTGSAVIKPESDATLSQMVLLLRSTPALKVFIVGHTDNVGMLDMNVKLSADRADALVKALVARGIVASRLRAFGAGPFCPVASNRDEPGRAQNRRVELVEQ